MEEEEEDDSEDDDDGEQKVYIQIDRENGETIHVKISWTYWHSSIHYIIWYSLVREKARKVLKILLAEILSDKINFHS